MLKMHSSKVMTKFIFLISICLFVSFQLNAQSHKDPLSRVDSTEISKTLIKRTAKIMKILEIKIRVNLDKDGPITLNIDSSSFAFNAEFRRGKMGDVVNYNTPDCYYLAPKMLIPPTLYSILFKKSDTTYIAYLKGVSIIVHELTHYLQTTNDDKTYFVLKYYEQLKDYILQPTEIEAWAVNSYFFLSYYDKNKLKGIMSLDENMHRKMELLIDAYRLYVKPQEAELF
jgi:hypothetical protein